MGTTTGIGIFFPASLVILTMMRTRMIAALLLAAASASLAQVRLPQLPGRLPGVELPSRLPTEGLRYTRLPVVEELQSSVQGRLERVQDLLRQHPRTLEVDPRGALVRRGELLWGDPPDAALQEALALGFRLLRESRLEALGLRLLVLAPPSGQSLSAAEQALRRLAPESDLDFHHVYGAAGEDPRPGAPASAAAGRGVGARIGLIDGGIDTGHAALRGASLQRWGCEGKAIASVHGTAIASLLVGRDGAFQGLLSEGRLYAADIYCGAADAGAVETLVQALAWLLREQVPVVNLSLVGPPNRLLERAVQAAQARGVLLVAAVGNDGPAAAPLYPAAYPGVVGVTGVLANRRVLPEAGRGPQVLLAAPGAGLAVAHAGAYAQARGTSYAAPLVAALLAARCPAPGCGAAALQGLLREAVDLGDPGRDPVFGWGLVAESARRAAVAPN